MMQEIKEDQGIWVFFIIIVFAGTLAIILTMADILTLSFFAIGLIVYLFRPALFKIKKTP